MPHRVCVSEAWLQQVRFLADHHRHHRHQFSGSKTRQSNMCNKTKRAGQQGH